MKPDLKKLILSLAIPLTVGGVAALLSGGMDTYGQLRQPPLAPPGWVFPVVWTVLYLLMGYSAYRVLTSDAEQPEKRRALIFYGVQLAVNFLWPLIFFGLGRYTLAFPVLAVLWLLVLLTMQAFYEADTVAGNLLIPYFLWVTFAGYLNAGVALLN